MDLDTQSIGVSGWTFTNCKIRKKNHESLAGNHASARVVIDAEGVHTIPGRGTVATGKIDQGFVRIGNPLEILGLGEVMTTVCTGIEAFKQPLERGEAGQNVGLLLRGIKTEQIQRGQVIAAPRTIRPGENAVVRVALDKEVAIDIGTHCAMREGGRTVGSGVVTQVVD